MRNLCSNWAFAKLRSENIGVEGGGATSDDSVSYNKKFLFFLSFQSLVIIQVSYHMQIWSDKGN